MKNTLFLFILIAFSVISHAQTRTVFELTPKGFINKSDTALNYIIQDYAGTSKDELYRRTVKYLSKQFASPKDVLSLVENESITINAIEDRVPVKSYSGRFTLNYTLTIEFKDNKLRILAPSINRIYGYPVRDVIEIGILPAAQYSRSIFTDKGVLKLDTTKKFIDLTFQAWVVKIAMGIEEGKTDNW
jgi:hypothetical protein